MTRARQITEGLRDLGNKIDDTVDRVVRARQNAMRRAAGVLAAGSAGIMAYNSLKHGTITGEEQLPYSRKGVQHGTEN